MKGVVVLAVPHAIAVEISRQDVNVEMVHRRAGVDTGHDVLTPITPLLHFLLIVFQRLLAALFLRGVASKAALELFRHQQAQFLHFGLDLSAEDRIGECDEGVLEALGRVTREEKQVDGRFGE